jgi:leucyl aminopeptidase (aminopeptidase T)
MHYSRTVITLGTLTALAFSSSPGWAQDSASAAFRRRSWDQDTQTVAPKEPRRFEALAPRIVWSAQIKPGDVVAIRGGPHVVPAMEAFAMEVHRTGGIPLLLLESPRVFRSYFTAVPDRHLGRTSQAWQDFQAEGIDVEFNLPVFEDFLQTLADVPTERQGKVLAAFGATQAPLTERQNRNQMRRLSIAPPPTKSDVKLAGLDSNTYTRMYDRALNADYQSIAKNGRAVQQALQGARRVRITTPDGTDLTFAVRGRQVILDAGLVQPGTGGLLAARSAQLPGGAARLAPLEGSVNGKFRARRDQCDKAVRNEEIDVRAGMPTNVRAASDEACVKEAMQRAGRFGWVQIGLNPALRVNNPNVNLVAPLLDLGAGAVAVDFGTNQELGGANKTAAGGWYIVLPRATVEADGKVIVRNGQLTL